MDKIIKIIKDRIAECEKSGNMFNLPYIEGIKVTVQDLPNEGFDLFHQEYNLVLPDGSTIDIDYRSKDKCRTFQMNPDRSVISVKCSNSEFDFCDAWDERV